MSAPRTKKTAQPAENTADIAAVWFSDAVPAFMGVTPQEAETSITSALRSASVKGKSARKRAVNPAPKASEPAAEVEHAAKSDAPAPKAKKPKASVEPAASSSSSSSAAATSASAWFAEMAARVAAAKASAEGGAPVLLSERPDVWDAKADRKAVVRASKDAAAAAASGPKKGIDAALQRRLARAVGKDGLTDVGSRRGGQIVRDEDRGGFLGDLMKKQQAGAGGIGSSLYDDVDIDSDDASAGAGAVHDDDDDDDEDDSEDGAGDAAAVAAAAATVDSDPHVVLPLSVAAAANLPAAPSTLRLQLVDSHMDKLQAVAAFLDTYRTRERAAGVRERSRAIVFVEDGKVARALEPLLGQKILTRRTTTRGYSGAGKEARVKGIAVLHDALPAWQRDLHVRRFRAGKVETMIATDDDAGPLWLHRGKIGLVIHCDVPAGKHGAMSTMEQREGFIGRPRAAIPHVPAPEGAAPAAAAVDMRKNEVFMVLNSTNANKDFAGRYAPIASKRGAARVAEALEGFAKTRNKKPLGA